MMFFRHNPTKRAKAFEKKGDKLFAKEKFNEAFTAYEKSWHFDGTRPQIYPKLIASFEKLERDWTQEDFELTLSWTMAQQELENPAIKHVHEKFSPEYQTAQRLIQQFLVTPTETEIQELTEKILNHGKSATLALLDFISHMKENAADLEGTKIEKEVSP